MPSDATLQELRAGFAGGRRFFALPLAGVVAWTLAGVLGAILPTFAAALALFFCTGMTFPLGLLIARFTGENLMDRESELGRLMGLNVLMTSLVCSRSMS
jgi:hypothetical protein